MPAGSRAWRTLMGLVASCGWLAAAGHAQPAAPEPLRAGSTVERDIQRDAPHLYELPLTAGQYIEIALTDNLPLRNLAPPEALDLTLRTSSGDTLRRFSRETSTSGVRRACFVAEKADTYSVTVSATQPLRYTLRVVAIREAAAVDRTRSRAVADFIDAEELRARRTPETNRQAIARYLAAASAWTELADRPEAAHAWHRLALVYSLLSDFPRSLETDARAAALAREAGDRRGEAAALNSSGITQIRIGDLPEALRRFEQALAIFREISDRDSEAYTLTAIGVIYQSMRNAQTGLEYFPQAITAWKEVGNREGEALAMHDTGTAQRLIGRLDEAMVTLNETLAIHRALDHRLLAAATLTQIGHTHLALGDVGAAFKAYEEGLALQSSVGEWRDEWAGSGAMGQVAERGDWPAAIELFSAGAGMFQAAGERDVEARILLSPLRSNGSRADAGDVRRGIDVMTRARPFLRSVSRGRWAAVVDTAIANLYVLLGEPARAVELYPGALSSFRAIRDRDGESTALAGLALAEAYTGKVAEARGHAADAVRLIESFHADVADPEVRALYISRNRGVYALYTGLEMLMESREPGRGHMEAALAATERARARGFVDQLYTTRRQLTTGVDKQLIAREQTVSDAMAKADEREVNGLAAELGEIRRQIRIQSPRYAALTQPPTLDAAGLQRLLDADTVLLEYWLAPSRSFVWVVTRDSISSANLAVRPDIEAAARRAYDLVSRGPRRDMQVQTRRALESLADLIITPVAARLDKRRVIVVPDAALQYVPFSALPMPAASGSVEREPLIAQHEVVMLPSASALEALRNAERSSNPPLRDLAVFADPVLRADDARVKPAANRAASTRGSDSLERLPHTREEANAIAALVPPGRALTALDFAASRDTALAEAGRARIVHFATHALVDGNHPEQSSIALSAVDRRGAPVDGFLRLGDIYNMRLNADLVVLSACRTALGKELSGEGLIGLTRGFLYAGAPAVVASLWDVSDRSTAELMTRFYRAMLRDRLPPAAALRAAKISMWRDPRWSAPTHWAGFILQGDWATDRGANGR